jgi:L-rhamnose mutarotase
MSRRIVRALDLVRDAALIAAYEACHAPGAVPADVVRDLRERGFQDMEIWRVADRLVMIAEVAEDFPRPPDPSLQAAVDDWERRMDNFQRPIAEGPKWAEMTRIFTLSEQ